MGVKSNRLEGRGASQLAQYIARKGRNTDVLVRLGTVTSPPPNFGFRIDNVALDFDASDAVVAEHLTAHERTVTISGGEVSGATSSAGDPSHTHDITEWSVDDATMTVDHALQAGARIIVATEFTDLGERHYVLDRVGEV